MVHRPHISQALAASTVHGPDIIVSIVRASCARTSAERLEYLTSALNDASEIVRDLQAAIAIEMQPVTPAEATERCLLILERDR